MKTSKKFFQNFLFVILIFLLISALFAFFSPLSSEKKEEIPLSQFVQDIEQGKITEMVLKKEELIGEMNLAFLNVGKKKEETLQ